MKNAFKGVLSYFNPPEEEIDMEEREEIEEVEERPIKHTKQHPLQQTTQHMGQQSARVVSMNGGLSKQDLLNLTMSSYDMTGEIAEYIKAKKPIVVNMQKLDASDMQRAIDFLTGACMALNGSVQKVADSIFIFAPEHITVNQEDAATKIKRNKQKMSWPRS